jgi:hypothetical protein
VRALPNPRIHQIRQEKFGLGDAPVKENSGWGWLRLIIKSMTMGLPGGPRFHTKKFEHYVEVINAAA